MTKPFDYAAAKAGAPVQTRDGRKARIVCWDLRDDKYRVAAAVTNGEIEDVWTYTVAGKFDHWGPDGDEDLVMAPRKRTVWVNVYRRTDSMEASLWDSQSEADDMANKASRIGGRAWPLEIEE